MITANDLRWIPEDGPETFDIDNEVTNKTELRYGDMVMLCVDYYYDQNVIIVIDQDPDTKNVTCIMPRVSLDDNGEVILGHDLIAPEYVKYYTANFVVIKVEDRFRIEWDVENTKVDDFNIDSLDVVIPNRGITLEIARNLYPEDCAETNYGYKYTKIIIPYKWFHNKMYKIKKSEVKNAHIFDVEYIMSCFWCIYAVKQRDFAIKGANKEHSRLMHQVCAEIEFAPEGTFGERMKEGGVEWQNQKMALSGHDTV